MKFYLFLASLLIISLGLFLNHQFSLSSSSPKPFSTTDDERFFETWSMDQVKHLPLLPSTLPSPASSTYRYSPSHTGVAGLDARLGSQGLALSWISEPSLNSYTYTASKSSPALDSSHLYIGTDTGLLLSIDRKTGSITSRFRIRATETGKGIHGSPTVAWVEELGDSVVLIGGYDGWLYCLKTPDLELVWETELGDFIGSSPVLWKGIVYIGVEFLPSDGQLLGVELATGKPVFGSDSLGGHPHSTPSIDTVSNSIVIGSNAGIFAAYDLSWFYDCVKGKDEEEQRSKCGGSASKRWSISFEGSKETGLKEIKSTAAIVDGIAYITSWNRKLYAIDVVTGQEKWSAHLESPSMSSPSVYDSRVYVGSTDGLIRCFDTDSGSLIWSIDTQGPVVSSTTLLPSEGLGVVGSNSSSIWIFDTLTGSVLDVLYLRSGLTGVPVIEGPHLYAFDHAGYLYSWISTQVLQEYKERPIPRSALSSVPLPSKEAAEKMKNDVPEHIQEAAGYVSSMIQNQQRSGRWVDKDDDGQKLQQNPSKTLQVSSAQRPKPSSKLIDSVKMNSNYSSVPIQDYGDGYSDYDDIMGNGSSMNRSGADEEEDSWSKRNLGFFSFLTVLIGLVVFAFIFVRGGDAEGDVDYAAAHKAFVDGVDPDQIASTLETITSYAHIAGSKGDKKIADWLAQQWTDFGIPNVEVEMYYPLLNLPVERVIETAGGDDGEYFKASMMEPPVEGDPTSYRDDAVDTFLGYGASGDATGELVYAHYGRYEDFELLDDLGVDLKGKIVIVRYGQIFRGLKVKFAEQRGAEAVIIYSDPIDDGFSRGPVYPEGKWRPAASAQRGSAQYLSDYAGDPLTPGTPATDPDSPFTDEDLEAANIPGIPALPLSYGDAEPLLARIGGLNYTAWADGGLDVPYNIGPGPVKVHVKADMNFFKAPIYNVMARIPSFDSLEKDAQGDTTSARPSIVFGNHHDAWVFGAADPNSGTAIMNEFARGIGSLLSTGWRPRRDIILGSWSGEEYGLIGSTEWVEDNLSFVQSSVVAYVNLDVGVCDDDFWLSSVPVFNALAWETAKQVTPFHNPEISVYDDWLAKQNERSPVPHVTPAITTLGSGSDFTPFLQHAGIPSMDMGYGRGYATYHSNYDSFTWMKKFIDPEFKYHGTVTRMVGSIVLHLSDDQLLPFDYVEYADVLLTHYHSILERAKLTFSPKELDMIDIGRLEGALSLFSSAAISLSSELSAVQAAIASDDQFTTHVSDEQLDRLNEGLQYIEQLFLNPVGLPGREWYKHVLFAPAARLGYGGTVLPGVSESVDNNDAHSMAYEVEYAAHVLKKAAIAMAAIKQ